MSKRSPGIGTSYDTLTEQRAERAASDCLRWMRQGYGSGPIMAGIAEHHGKFHDEEVESIIEAAGQQFRELPEDKRRLARPLSAEEKAAKQEVNRQKLVDRGEWIEAATDWMADRLVQLPPDPHLEEAVHLMTEEAFAVWRDRIGTDGIKVAYGLAQQRLDKERDRRAAERFEQVKSLFVARWSADENYGGDLIIREAKMIHGDIADDKLQLVIAVAANICRARGVYVGDDARQAAFAMVVKAEPRPIKDAIMLPSALLQ